MNNQKLSIADAFEKGIFSGQIRAASVLVNDAIGRMERENAPAEIITLLEDARRSLLFATTKTEVWAEKTSGYRSPAPAESEGSADDNR